MTCKFFRSSDLPVVPFVQADQVFPEDLWVPREKYKDRELEVCLVKANAALF